MPLAGIDAGPDHSASSCDGSKELLGSGGSGLFVDIPNGIDLSRNKEWGNFAYLSSMV